VNTGPNGILGDADDAPLCTSVLNRQHIMIPFDVFRSGTLTPQLLSYLVTPGFQIGTTSEWVVNASFNGETGIVSPWAESPLAAAFGGEYRQEKLEHRTDVAFTTGDLAGQGGPTPSTAGSFDVWEAFGEISLPIVQDAPWAKEIEINGGYRISDYETAGITHTYKYGGSWSPTEDVRFRGSFQRAVRAPKCRTVRTSFLCGAGRSLRRERPSAGSRRRNARTLGSAFRLATSRPARTLRLSAQCAARFGNTTEAGGWIPTFGIVFTDLPQRLQASVDYFDIFVDKVIGAVPQAVI
jgi:outer membrane receptor protein involved in Fe transport